MQQEFLTFLRERRIVYCPPGALMHREVVGEQELKNARGHVIAFIDAAEIVTINLFTVVNLFEIKPVIDTVYGIIRQAKLAQAAAERTIKADQFHSHIVVPALDPKLMDLKREWPLVWAWGIEFDQEDAA